jgi:hypothetical protein
MQLREAVLNAQEEILALRQENLDPKAAAKRRDSLEYEKGVYWMVKDDEEREGPFCQICCDKDGRLGRLSEGGSRFRLLLLLQDL